MALGLLRRSLLPHPHLRPHPQPAEEVGIGILCQGLIADVLHIRIQTLQLLQLIGENPLIHHTLNGQGQLLQLVNVRLAIFEWLLLRLLLYLLRMLLLFRG